MLPQAAGRGKMDGMFRKLLLHILLLLSLSAAASAAEVKVWSSAAHQFVPLDTVLTQLATSDVVFLGEIHNNPVCHQVELTVLQGLAARRPQMALGMEMFERDVQPVLDGYLSGAVTADEFLAQARPWPNYQTDYRPLVEFAHDHHIPVLASNLPQSLATAVARQGLAALQQVPIHVMRYFARHTTAPEDKYLELFEQAMSGHSGVHSGHGNDAMMRFYTAQCLKDDTMAESVSDYLTQAGAQQPLVLHVNGEFHTAYGLGTAARTRQRLPGAHVSVVTMVSVDNPDQVVDGQQYDDQGDYVIFVPALREPGE